MTQPLQLGRVRHDAGVDLAVIGEDTVTLMPRFDGDMLSLIEEGPAGLQSARTARDSAQATRIPRANVELLAPIDLSPRDVMCTGWNYWDHFEEGRAQRAQDVPRPAAPTFFTKRASAVIGPRRPIALDERISAKWDYEAELVVVIGKTGRSIPKSRAMDHVFGYCLANDVSQRDLQRRHGGQWLKGKSIDGTMPLGPWIVPAGEMDPYSVQLQCLLNGEVMQDASVQQMAFPIAELIAELSFGMTLLAGDVILTGTPSGVGNSRTPPIYLKPGDRVVVRGTGLGELSNEVTTADLAGASDVRPLA
jgi:2-keto-4-pentenoate hydratase/2-oxohepta-3-ene-1,7-dioic acid hydratase in catechol pathway